MTDEKNINVDGETSAHHVELGELLDVQSTPEEQRKVLWKLDLV